MQMRNVLSFYALFWAPSRSSLLSGILQSLHVRIQSRHQELAEACVVAGSLGPASTPSKRRISTRPLCHCCELVGH
ncbi:hypothetical protein EDD15DRAFT_2285142 [Pisolithus albus]|nr:hypothetical protein EDD15DRAFT_2285142 [Pisolithus albus]